MEEVGFWADRISSLLETLSRSGVTLNVDNLQELEEVAACVESGTSRNIGIRVNPQVGAGTMEGFSTGTATSKFGVGLCDDGGAPILSAYARHPWLNTIMCHVGSQGIPLKLAVQGVRATVDFALRVNRELKRNQIRHVDIGGGEMGKRMSFSRYMYLVFCALLLSLLTCE